MNKQYKEEREKLLNETLKYRNAIKGNLKGSVQQVEGQGKKLLLGAGIVVGSYLVLNLLTSRKKVKTIVKPSESSSIGTTQEEQVVVVEKKDSAMVKMVKDQMTSFFISLAKQKVLEFLEQVKVKAKLAKKEKTK